MKIAYLSPLPPTRSGVSEYSADLIPHLVPRASLRLFAPAPAGGSLEGLPVEAPAAFDGAEFDVAVYHMGNNAHHRFVHERALTVPGMLVLHDLVLHHFYVEETLAHGDQIGYAELMRSTYGDAGWTAGLARIHDATSDLTYFLFPLFERVAAASRGVVVHNRRAARLIRERVANVPVSVVPMGIPAASVDPLPDRAASRVSLGLTDKTTTIGMFGFTTPIKRPHIALRAFAAARPRLGASRFVIVGEVSESLDLAGEARRLGIAEYVTLAGYLDYSEVKRWVAATDVFVNLRYPTAGETSASLLRLLGWGKPVIVSDYAQFRELPAEVAPRVTVDDREQDELRAVMVLLGQRPDLRAGFAASAARFVAQEHTLEGAARGYLEFATELMMARPRRQPRLLPFEAGQTSRTPAWPRAEVAAGSLPSLVAPRARLTLPVTIRNIGEGVWLREPFPEGGFVVFGGYVRRPWGESLGELRWSALQRDVAPGEQVRIDWRFEMPDCEGPVEVVADVKIAGWGFLHLRGSRALVYRMTLSASA